MDYPGPNVITRALPRGRLKSQSRCDDGNNGQRERYENTTLLALTMKEKSIS